MIRAVVAVALVLAKSLVVVEVKVEGALQARHRNEYLRDSRSRRCSFRALADACEIEPYATDLNLSLHAPEGAT